MSTTPAVTGYAARNLRLVLNTYAGAELPHWETFLGCIELEGLAANDSLFRADGEHASLYMVQRGLLKCVVPVGHRDQTVFFAEEGDIFAPFSALGVDRLLCQSAGTLHPRETSMAAVMNEARRQSVIALEPSVVLRVDAEVVLSLAAKNAGWARLLFNIVLMRATVLQADVHWLRLKPEERYLELCRRNPSLVSRVSQYELARYLNVNQSSLSRIARRTQSAPET